MTDPQSSPPPLIIADDSPTDGTPDDEKDAQPLMGHLLELRDRLMKSTAALVVGIVIGLIFARQFLELLIYLLQGASQLQLLSPAEPIFLYLKASLIIGGLIASPFVFIRYLRLSCPD